MTKRKRKSPKRKSQSRVLGFLSGGAAALARLAARHPVVIGGAAAFCIVFGFVAANALWYQPGRHPSPFLRTRDVNDFNALAGVKRNPLLNHDPAKVTTFRIEREEVAGESAATSAPQDDGGALVMAVQQELARRKLYEGVADGVAGPQTGAAIARFQKSVGMQEDGQVSPELLAALKVDGGAVAALPKPRPAGDLTSPEAIRDPVAAAIRSAEQTIVTVSKQRQADSRPAPVGVSLRPGERLEVASNGAGQADLVMAIQRGLSNIAYADVRVDGVAGEQTRAAIRHFERHYRLPETGEPSEAVLKKLKDIGAL